MTVVYTIRREAVRIISFRRARHEERNIKSYTASQLKAKRAESRTDLGGIDAVSDDELERLVAEDEDERDIRPGRTQAKLVLPRARQSVHLRLEQDVIDFFKSQG